MRAQKLIPLDDSRSVTLNELRVKDARKLMAQAKGLENVDIRELLGERFHEVCALLGDCIVMPDGETLDDLAFGEVAEIIDGLLEVNAPFLDVLGLAGLSPKIPSPTSIDPVSPSSSEATSA
jgi:hypothetical protein